VGGSVQKALASPMPEPELAREGVYADAWEPLGDGRSPWSFWERAGGGGNGAAARPQEVKAL
jgi:hypothetical protein